MKKTRRIMVGSVPVGGGAPVAVQSMTKTQTENVRATISQIKRMAAAGCEIARVAIPGPGAVCAFAAIKAASPIPVVADVHFSAELAIAALDAGADCVRVNPGNIGGRGEFRRVAAAARNLGRSVRIGVNSGSLYPPVKNNSRFSASEKLVESALIFMESAEKAKLTEYKVSLKSSDPLIMIEAHRVMSRRSDVPLHIGVTEAGDRFAGAVRSAVGIGVLLSEGIGDTVRVSLSAPPEAEISAAWEILRSLGLRRRGVEVISCPGCSRTRADISKIAAEVIRSTARVTTPLKAAVMGCEVNGPGESEGADAAIILGRGKTAALYVGGKFAARVPAADAAAALAAQIIKLSV
jgi:(E)-4-hydroxy-3-methylbut-2-enyl-diphosphate synthase